MTGKNRRSDAAKIAFSFDDGPGVATATILDVLALHDAKATFFVRGEVIREHADVVRQIASEGHELANHTYSHPRLGTLPMEDLERELRSTSELIEELSGTRPTLFRPPYGLDGIVAKPVAAALGMATVRWSLNAKDYDDSDPASIAQRILTGAYRDAVIVLHDGGDGREVTVQALRIVLPSLREQGYSMVTMSTLLRRSQRARRQVVVKRRGRFRQTIGWARRRVMPLCCYAAPSVVLL